MEVVHEEVREGPEVRGGVLELHGEGEVRLGEDQGVGEALDAEILNMLINVGNLKISFPTVLATNVFSDNGYC